MGERSEANSDLKADRKQNKENATAFLFLAKEPQTGMGEQSEANSSFETSTIRRLQDTQQIQFSAFTFHLSPQTEMGEQSEANSYWNASHINTKGSKFCNFRALSIA